MGRGKWIKSPRGFRPDTKMPHFYKPDEQQPRGCSPRSEQEKFPDAEINSIAHYLFAKSKDYLGGRDDTSGTESRSRIAS